MSDENDIQVEAFPVETVYDLYECPKGHRQRGSGETIARNDEFPEGRDAAGALVSTGEVCITCYMYSMRGQFPTSKVEK